MDEKQLDCKDTSFQSWDLEDSKEERRKAFERVNAAMSSAKMMTNNPIILNGTPDKTTGLYFDKNFGKKDQDWMEQVEMPDIRRKAVEMEEKECCGMDFLKETKEMPDVTTLLEKDMKAGSYRTVLALAGVARKQHDTTFKKMEDQIIYMKNYANSMLRHCDEMQKQVDFLKQLVVLDYSE